MSRLTSSPICQLISIIIPILVIQHSFTLSLQAQNLAFQQILPTLDLFTYRNAFMTTGLDRTYHAHRFIISFTSIFFVSCDGLSWLPVSFLLHVKYTLSYRILSYRMVSYSFSIVTMAVSVAVCEIFSDKEWCDLENRVRVQGYWKWHHLIDRIRVPIRIP